MSYTRIDLYTSIYGNIYSFKVPKLFTGNYFETANTKFMLKTVFFPSLFEAFLLFSGSQIFKTSNSKNTNADHNLIDGTQELN